MTDIKKLAATDIITPEVRLSFPNLFEARVVPGSQNAKPKFSASLLLPPSFDLKLLQQSMAAAMTKKWGKVITLPAAKNPIKDAAEKEGLAGYETGWRFINVSANLESPPQVVDQRLLPVTDRTKVYAGMWVRAYLNAFAWEHAQGGKGVSFGLNAIQLMRDGERIDGRRATTDVFTPVDIAEGDAKGGDLGSLFE